MLSPWFFALVSVELAAPVLRTLGRVSPRRATSFLVSPRKEAKKATRLHRSACGRLPCAARSGRPARNSPAAPAQTAAPEGPARFSAARRFRRALSGLHASSGSAEAWLGVFLGRTLVRPDNSRVVKGAKGVASGPRSRRGTQPYLSTASTGIARSGRAVARRALYSAAMERPMTSRWMSLAPS